MLMGKGANQLQVCVIAKKLCLLCIERYQIACSNKRILTSRVEPSLKEQKDQGEEALSKPLDARTSQLLRVPWLRKSQV